MHKCIYIYIYRYTYTYTYTYTYIYMYVYICIYIEVVLKVRVEGGSIRKTFPRKEILIEKETYLVGILVTCNLNDYHIYTYTYIYMLTYMS